MSSTIHNICIANPSENRTKTKKKIGSRFFATYECAVVND